MGSRTMMAFRSFLGGRRKELSMQELNYDGCSSDYFSRNYSLLLRPPAHPPFPGFPSSREPFVTPKKSICSFFFFGGGAEDRGEEDSNGRICPTVVFEK